MSTHSTDPKNDRVNDPNSDDTNDHMRPPTGGNQRAGGGGHQGMAMRSSVTRPQLVAMTLLTLLALVSGVVVGGSFGDRLFNYQMRARDMAGLVMPSGMIRGVNPSVENMKDMAAVDVSQVRYTAPADARGDQPLAWQDVNGVKVFRLETSIIKWNILPDVQVAAYAYNRQVPGPRITITQGDRVRIIVKNDLPDPTSVHWHGLTLPNAMDGVADITQQPIAPGKSFTYEFTVTQWGTYFYHSHTAADRQEALGLYGALIVEPKDASQKPVYDQEALIQLGEWKVENGNTFPAMSMTGLEPNYFTINGKAYPATETINLKVGQRLLVRFMGTNSVDIHPMHIHGGPFQIVATDGNPVPEGARIQKDTVDVGPGERYDVIWTARMPGKWLLHCHINHHITNNNVEENGAGGLTVLINVTA